jgi:pyridoxamine 5'-phosphate oxidase
MRREYTRSSLNEADLAADPFQQFRTWFDDAIASDVFEPNAMTLATASPEGRPSARIVLLKGFDDRGFTFHTNYQSRKGQELDRNPFAALVLYWAPLERQVRIEGRVETIPAEESDEYFRTRPIGARLGAWASPQSRVIADRKGIEARLRDLEQDYPDGDIPRPPHWGGYRLDPDSVEFWQGGLHRIHDRLQYTRAAKGGWEIHRLAP